MNCANFAFSSGDFSDCGESGDTGESGYTSDSGRFIDSGDFCDAGESSDFGESGDFDEPGDSGESFTMPVEFICDSIMLLLSLVFWNGLQLIGLRETIL